MSSAALLALARPGGFAPDRRFAAPGAAPEPAPLDAGEEAYARGHADGFAEALALAGERAAEADAARERIELALVRLDKAAEAELRERLRQTVLALCDAAVAPLAIDPEGLCRRIAQATAMLQRKQDEKLVRLHPDDLALVHHRLPEGLAVEPDPTLERGALRLETGDGGIEDGPAQWRAIMAEALRAC